MSYTRTHRPRSVVEIPTLEDVAQTVADSPDQIATLEAISCLWLGDPNVIRRRMGDHPWVPYTTADGSERVGSVLVASAYSITRRGLEVMCVGHDPWHHPDDPESWVVKNANINTGEQAAYAVVDSRVTKYNDLRLRLARVNANMPPNMMINNSPPATATMLTAHLDYDYYTYGFDFRHGLNGTDHFGDFTVLVQAIRAARARETAALATVHDIGTHDRLIAAAQRMGATATGVTMPDDPLHLVGVA